MTYWFERARSLVEQGKAKRVGLLATQAIRAGASRAVLEAILKTGSIFFAWSNREWTLDGAAVRVSMVGFDNGEESSFQLNGEVAQNINSDLTTGTDLTKALSLTENSLLSFQGPVKVGHFELEPAEAEKMLAAPPNPNGLRNSEVVVPWIIAKDLTDRPNGMYIVDFRGRTESESALFEMPFEYVKKHVYAKRQKNKRARRRKFWWQHGERNLGMRKALKQLQRFIATPRVTKHRFFNSCPLGRWQIAELW